VIARTRSVSAVRGLVGDEGTALLYLLFAGLMIWIGLSTDWTFGGR
jgi:hypothetical protein